MSMGHVQVTWGAEARIRSAVARAIMIPFSPRAYLLASTMLDSAGKWT